MLSLHLLCAFIDLTGLAEENASGYKGTNDDVVAQGVCACVCVCVCVTLALLKRETNSDGK